MALQTSHPHLTFATRTHVGEVDVCGFAASIRSRDPADGLPVAPADTMSFVLEFVAPLAGRTAFRGAT